TRSHVHIFPYGGVTLAMTHAICSLDDISLARMAEVSQFLMGNGESPHANYLIPNRARAGSFEELAAHVTRAVVESIFTAPVDRVASPPSLFDCLQLPTASRSPIPKEEAFRLVAAI